MVDVASHLRDSGFSDDEIGVWAKTTRENLTAAGFKDEEVDDYLGLPKTPKGIPAAFVERMVTGAKIAAQISNLPKAYVDLAQGGYHIGQEAGQETLDALKGVRDKLLPKEFGGQRDIQQEAQTDVQKAMEGPGLGGLGVRTPTGLGDTGAGLFGAATLPFAPLQGVIHAVAGSPIIAAEHTMRAGAVSLYGEDKVRQAEETAGLTPGGMSKEDANKIIDTALMGMGNRPVSRIAMGPGGVPELQQIGGLPKGEDFSNASTMIGHGDTTPAMEGKLQDLYESKGIHPAEVAHDAQTDVTITQSMLSTDKADMPAAYGRDANLVLKSSENGKHKFSIVDAEGQETGNMSITEKSGGKDLYINFVGNATDGGPFGEVGSLGSANSRALLRQLKEQFPDAETVSGHRITGGREDETLVSVRLRRPDEAAGSAADILNERQPSEAGAGVSTELAAKGLRVERSADSFGERFNLVDDSGRTHYTASIDTESIPGVAGISYVQNKSRAFSKLGPLLYQELAKTFALEGKKFVVGLESSPSARKVHAQLEEIDSLKRISPEDITSDPEALAHLRQPYEDGSPRQLYEVLPPPEPEASLSRRNDILNERQPSSGGAAAVKPPAYSDAQQQVLSKISIDEKAPTAKLTWDKLYTNTMDKLFPLAKAVKASGETLAAEENPYQLARLLSGSAGKADHFLNNGTFDFHSYENNGPAMREILAPVKDDLNGFRAYMASARALELEGRGIKSGFDAGKAPSAPPLISAGLDAPRTVVVEGRNKFAQPLLDLVDYQNRVAAYARDAGVISDAGYSAMVKLNQLYVPFSRVMGLDEGSFIRGGGSSLQAKNPVKSITGSARDIIDPLESIIRNTHVMVEMAERNVVGTKLVDMLKRMEGEMPELPKATADVAVKDTARAAAMADEFGAVGVKNSDELAAALDHATAPLKEGEIAILRDGKRETYEVDPQLASAMKGLNSESAHWMVNLLSAPASLLRAGAVLTPQFWARHIMRDYLYATATSTAERGLFTPWDMAKGLAGLVVKDKDYWDWMKSGGGNASVAGLDRQYLQENLRELTGKTGLAGRAWNVVTDPNASMWQKTASVGTLPFQAIEKFVIDPLRAATQIAENASHLAAFKKGMRSQERAEPEATNLRDQIIRAGWASRDTAVDAARMGASMRAYNQVFAFGNIKLQDTDRVVRAFKDNPITASVLVAGAITVPAVTLWGINHDDPDYQELPQWEKDMFFIVPVGTAAPSPLHVAQGQARGEAPTNSAAMFMRLPKPWAMGMIFGSGVERMLEAYKGVNPTPFKEFGKDLYATSGPDFVPTAAAPIAEQWANRSTLTNRTMIPAAQEKFLPEYQYTPYTTELTKELGKVIGAFPGISQAKMENSGVGGVAKALTSPILMENYIRGWTGTLGMYTLQLADKSLRATGVLPDPPKPASTLADIPVIQAFVVRYPGANTESVQTFQDDYAKAQSFMTTWQAMAKDGNVQAMQHIQDMADTHMLEQLDGFHQAIGNLNQMVRLVYKNPDIPPDEKRQLIDQLYYGIIQTAQGGNHAIHAIREKAADVVSTRH